MEVDNDAMFDTQLNPDDITDPVLTLNTQLSPSQQLDVLTSMLTGGLQQAIPTSGTAQEQEEADPTMYKTAVDQCAGSLSRVYGAKKSSIYFSLFLPHGIE
eukprot:TRINITY_DN80763_c0_g1_i1.p1 TRINITY_DN80763_c0_g1~~TRINITY_DN80763_c0_g1_i1.p1  ORF type:complete len:110 (+),score=24.32 TRINITY_DN80763_c0_g1_i1:30-332(+)